MAKDVLFQEMDNGVATITLNRPKALHSLNSNMLHPIKQTIEQWKDNDAIKLVVLKSSSERAFCAGGDMKTIYEAKNNDEALRQADDFFTLEYSLDALLYDFPKPIVAMLDGIVMGGGVGLSYGASHRIVTDATKWAMPEMNIGFFPDVGAGYFLNKAPGSIGVYLALTGAVISGSDALYINCADHYVPKENVRQMIQDIERADWNETSIHNGLTNIIETYTSKAPTSDLATKQSIIDKHFHFETVKEIMASLANDSDSFAKETHDALSGKSAVSLKVARKHLLNNQDTTFESCLKTDLKLAKNFIRHDDFYEGVRSVLIDKDKQPHYTYKTLADVSDTFVKSFFN